MSETRFAIESTADVTAYLDAIGEAMRAAAIFERPLAIDSTAAWLISTDPPSPLRGNLVVIAFGTGLCVLYGSAACAVTGHPEPATVATLIGALIAGECIDDHPDVAVADCPHHRGARHATDRV